LNGDAPKRKKIGERLIDAWKKGPSEDPVDEEIYLTCRRKASTTGGGKASLIVPYVKRDFACGNARREHSRASRSKEVLRSDVGHRQD